jgi:addiction module HigA family antidote
VIADNQAEHQRHSRMTTLHNPPHPGEVLRDGVLADKGLTVTDFAKRLGVTRVALSRVLNGKAAISADMAVRLAAALGGSDESWLHLQANYDLWRALRALRAKVAKIARIAAGHDPVRALRQIAGVRG